MFLRLLTATTLLASPVLAEAPKVVADIAPVHSLVARVMEGVGTPDVLLPPGASPHGYSMRPSDAQALSDADLVIWMGEDLTPWLEDAITTLSGEEKALELLHLEGTHLLKGRHDAVFGAEEGDDHHDDHHGDHGDAHKDEHHDDHGEKEEHHDDHHDDEHKDDDHKDGHHDDDHKDEHHDDAHHDDEKHDDHDDHGDAHDHHNHGEHDPHAWLDPHNAAFWVDAFAARLSELDPANADTYAANAKAAKAEIEAVEASVAATLEGAKDKPYVVFHDAYQYFETAFDIPAVGALQLSDASSPSAGRLAAIETEIKEYKVECVFAEPQFNPRLVATVAGDTAKGLELDPLGAKIEPGPALYTALLADLATTISGCLAD